VKKGRSHAAVITPTACLYFAWSTTLLRVGGLAARLACIAAAAVPARPLQPPNTLRRGPDAKRTCLAVGADSVHTATPDTTKESYLRRVWRGDVNFILEYSSTLLTVSTYRMLAVITIMMICCMNCVCSAE